METAKVTASTSVNTVAFIGNHLPRPCGIATFTTDLAGAVADTGRDVTVVAMDDPGSEYNYPEPVRLSIARDDPAQYAHAARFLNERQIDVVSLQHEYGIFGGSAGRHILRMLWDLDMPIVTTLHTVLDEPSEPERRVMEEICEVSDRLVVMSRRAVQMLQDIYGVPADAVRMIHHGTPDVPFIDPSYYKEQFGVAGRTLILSFGLLSPGKGVECMIEALPEILARHPDVLYMVVGKTHPRLVASDGEAYRTSLIERAEELGVEAHLRFENRFVDLDDLCSYLCAADLYTTTYLSRRQITSGTLAYAMATGNAVVSTPYWYAEEMLADGRGVLVPFRDPTATARAINRLLDDDVERHAIRRRAYEYSRQMIWPRVAEQYVRLFEEARAGRCLRPRTMRPISSGRVASDQINLAHLRRMTDDTGILQHAYHSVPDRNHGYCTDDVARALVAAASCNGQAGDLCSTYMSFLRHAYCEETRRFRNFMTYDRRWLEEQGSEDSHGRALWALGTFAGLTDDDAMRVAASEMFERALEPLSEFTSPRALAYSALGCANYLENVCRDLRVARALRNMIDRLKHRCSEGCREYWPWLESCVTYDNARIPEALIRGGMYLDDDAATAAGLQMLDWLLDVQTTEDQVLAPVGSDGWFEAGSQPARFDQQPLEACALSSACLAAHDATGERRWLEHALRCGGWFVGENALGAFLYDADTGACRDGLRADGVNRNQGAESTVSALLAMLDREEVLRRMQPRLDLQVTSARRTDRRGAGVVGRV